MISVVAELSLLKALMTLDTLFVTSSLDNLDPSVEYRRDVKFEAVKDGVATGERPILVAVRRVVAVAVERGGAAERRRTLVAGLRESIFICFSFFLSKCLLESGRRYNYPYFPIF